MAWREGCSEELGAGPVWTRGRRVGEEQGFPVPRSGLKSGLCHFPAVMLGRHSTSQAPLGIPSKVCGRRNEKGAGQRPTVEHRELCVILCNGLNGERI